MNTRRRERNDAHRQRVHVQFDPEGWTHLRGQHLKRATPDAEKRAAYDRDQGVLIGALVVGAVAVASIVAMAWGLA